MLELLLGSQSSGSEAIKTKALIQAKHGFKEISNDLIVTNTGTPVISNELGKFDNKSFNFTNGFIGVGENSDFNFTKNNEFTIEQWQYINAFNGNNWFVSKGSGVSSCLKIFNTDIYLQTVSKYASLASTAALKIKQWQHVAIVQNEKNIVVYVDGKIKLSIASTDAFGSSEKQFKFGGGDIYNYNCNGYFDQMRISSVARYNSEFIPQETPFVID